MEIWKRLFGKKGKNIKTVDDNTQDSHAQNPITTNESKEPYDYGLREFKFAIRSGDYGWSEPTYHKKVFLVNPFDCKERINVMDLAERWKGTGHTEWEYLLAGMFLDAVLDAIEINSQRADITCMFDRDLTASNGRKLTQAQIYELIIKSFDIVEENDDVLKLRFRI